MPYPGEIIGGTYQIIEEIGTGGVGIIYRAYHLNLRKNVVVKKIKENFAGALEARGEVDILKSLHHSNLPQVYDFLQVGNEVYTVMDYIDGHDLKYYLDQGYYFEESLLWQWMTQLCEVLEYLHDHGILHLDIKPANIMLTSEGKLYLIDFNISFSGEVENMSGISPYYASPEQYQNWNAMLYGELQHLKSLDESTDIYSLGATFYHLMSGIQPTSQLEYLVPITRYQLEYSPALIAMINKMMSPKKENRYHSTKKILDVIRKAQRTREEKRTLRMVFWGMTCAVIILLGTMGILFFRGGTNSLDSEQIRQQENRLWEVYEAGDYEAAYENGLQLLKSMGTSKEMEEAEIAVLEILSNSCIEMERYQEALQYAEELLNQKETLSYYTNAAVAAAYIGEYTKTEAYLDIAVRKYGDQKSIIEIQAEVKASQENYQEALELYKSLPNWEQEKDILRRMGVIALKASKEDQSYGELAVDCYEKMYQSQVMLYSDHMNLVSAYLTCGMDQKALSHLQEMQVLYSDCYEVFANSGILRYNMEIQKAPAKRNFAKAKKEMEKAVQLYDASVSEKGDVLIEDLRELLETLP